MIRIKNILLLGFVSCFLVVRCGQKQEQSEKAGTQTEQNMSQIKTVDPILSGTLECFVRTSRVGETGSTMNDLTGG